MSGPKDYKLGGDASSAQAEPDAAAAAAAPKPAPERPQPDAANALSYAGRFAAQRYHPVVLIGSAGSGKTVLLLSLLAYFRSGGNERRLSVFFGDDLFRPADEYLRNEAKKYFNMSVTEYLRGTTEVATRYDAPIFIPVKVAGEGQPELKFALMESNGEQIHPKASDGPNFFPKFWDELAGLLRQYPDGISFIWVAPRTTPGPSGKSVADKEELIGRANESLLGAFGNYKALRSNNSERDSHMLVVTQWDTHVSDTAPANLRENLDRKNDTYVTHEVENFLQTAYPGTYGVYQSLNSGNKVVFRYSAGLFNERSRNAGNLDDVLRTYARDVWNWLYDGMRSCHDWNLEPGPLLPKPPVPRKTLLQRWDEIVTAFLG